jgi:mono/diheme cytochrome c family protein
MTGSAKQSLAQQAERARPKNMRKRTTETMIRAAGLAVSVLMSSAALAEGTLTHFVFGTAVTPQGSDNTVAAPVYGRGTFALPLYGGLPPGSGNAAAGAKVYAARCSACHGGKPHLGSYTMQSCWRHTKTLFHFVKRAMPFNAPGSLKNNEIYAVVAYLLSDAGIIKPKEAMNAKSLPTVVMPNRDGLVPNVCPELSLW